jgi:hypothetical protein
LGSTIAVVSREERPIAEVLKAAEEDPRRVYRRITDMKNPPRLRPGGRKHSKLLFSRSWRAALAAASATHTLWT